MILTETLKRLLNNANSIYIINGFAAIAAIAGVLLILSSNEIATGPDGVAEAPVSNEMSALQNKALQLEKMLVDQPDNAHLNIDMGNTLFDLRQYKEAVPYYRNALAVAPDHAEVWIDLGVCYFNMRDFDSAIASMQEALSRNPTHVKGLFNLGIIYYNNNQMDAAKSQWQKLIELHGDSPEAEIANKLLIKINS